MVDPARHSRSASLRPIPGMYAASPSDNMLAPAYLAPPASFSRESSPSGSIRSMDSSQSDQSNEAAALRPPPKQSGRSALVTRWLHRDEYDEEKVNLHRGPYGTSRYGETSKPGFAATVKSKLPERRSRRIALFSGIAFLILLIILLATLIPTLLRRKIGAPALVFGDTKSVDGGNDPAVVDVVYGKYQGVSLPNNVTQWLGMRYSGPVTGKNRFGAPTAPLPFKGVQLANKPIKGCHGVGPNSAGTNEDCLSIDVYAPSSASRDSRLPVFVWIQGGGNQGATQHINGSQILESSGMGMVLATITYRVGAYGFLASSEVQSKASLNNGYKDQRQALRWVKNNIERFGGSADSITIGGQSAGGGAILAHLTAFGNRSNDGLFHAAIAQSPSMPAVRTVKEQQFQYDDLAKRLNCDKARDTLECLRGVPHTKFLAQVGVIPFPGGSGRKPVFGWNPVVDDDFVNQLPSAALANGDFVRVPTIVGDVTNEGSIFAPHSLKNGDDIWAFLRGTFPALDDKARTKLDELYNLSAPGLKPDAVQRLASQVYGEMRYICGAQQLADAMGANAGDTPLWRYQFDALDSRSAAAGLGVPHGAEMSTIFGLRSGAGKDFPSYAPGGPNAGILPLMAGYWTSFVMNHDPNSHRAPGAASWDAAASGSAARHMYISTKKSAMQSIDQAQLKRCEYIASIAESIEQ